MFENIRKTKMADEQVILNEPPPLFWIGWSLSRIADQYCTKDKAP